MKSLRTPDARFVDLPDYPFAAHHVDLGDGLRMAYVDEGRREAPVVLLLHGEPTWSFMYRKTIARVVGAGLRAVAPDLVGFGRSDKPEERESYSFASHLAWLRSFLSQTRLERISLVCHDWGGLLGLRLVAEAPDRFARVIASNTFLPTGGDRITDAFQSWRSFSQSTPVFPVSRIVSAGCARPLPDDVARAYEAPFPDETYKAGARQFPILVPIAKDDPEAEKSRAAWKTLERFERPFLTLFGDSDPITKGLERIMQERIPGAKGQPHAILEQAGHFAFEDAADAMNDRIVAFLRG